LGVHGRGVSAVEGATSGGGFMGNEARLLIRDQYNFNFGGPIVVADDWIEVKFGS
jgi:hypothetical protein